MLDHKVKVMTYLRESRNLYLLISSAAPDVSNSTSIIVIGSSITAQLL